MTEHRNLLTCGEHAVLVEVEGLDQVLAFAHAVREAVAAGTPGFTDIVDIVPAATTVLVVSAEKGRHRDATPSSGHPAGRRSWGGGGKRPGDRDPGAL